MKNIYITMIPLQGASKFSKMNYVPQEGICADEDMETRFPIIPVMRKTMSPEVETKVIAIQMKNKDTEHNLELLKEELKEIECDPDCLTCIELQEDSRYATSVNMYLQIMEEIEDDSDIYACITYGTKVMGWVLSHVLSDIPNLHNNTVVKSVCYGQIVRDDGVVRDDGQTVAARLWEEVGMLDISDLTQTLAKLKLNNPKKALESLLDTEN